MKLTSVEERRAAAIRLVGAICEDWMITADEIGAATHGAGDEHTCGHHAAEHVAFQQGAELAGELAPPAWLVGAELRRAWEDGAQERAATWARLRRKITEAIARLEEQEAYELAGELEIAAVAVLGAEPPPAPVELDAEGFPAAWSPRAKGGPSSPRDVWISPTFPRDRDLDTYETIAAPLAAAALYATCTGCGALVPAFWAGAHVMKCPQCPSSARRLGGTLTIVDLYPGGGEQLRMPAPTVCRGFVASTPNGDECARCGRFRGWHERR